MTIIYPWALAQDDEDMSGDSDDELEEEEEEICPPGCDPALYDQASRPCTCTRGSVNAF